MSISAKPRISLAPLAMGILLGCSEARVQRAGTAQIDTLPDGRIEVTNSGAPAWAPGSEWRLVQDLRLGTENTAGPEQFNRIAALLADSLGMIYVLDLLAPEIRVFDSTGVFSHTIGRKGEGPGEFTDAAWMTFGPGDTLWVIDRGSARYSMRATSSCSPMWQGVPTAPL